MKRLLISTLFPTIALLMVMSASSAAVLLGRDYPYYIFEDGGKLRYCMQPDGPEDRTIDCWANGIKQVCKIVTVEDGWIDCKEQ